MSTTEEVELHEAVASYPEGQKPPEQPADAARGTVNKVNTSLLKKISLTVLTLLGYTSTFAAISDVTAFYAILVSSTAGEVMLECVACGHTFG